MTITVTKPGPAMKERTAVLVVPPISTSMDTQLLRGIAMMRTTPSIQMPQTSPVTALIKTAMVLMQERL